MIEKDSTFLWGAGTAAHQVEGNNHNQWSAWELQNAASLAERAKFRDNKLPHWQRIKPMVTDPGNYISGRAVDHYHLYESDLDLAQQLNFNSLRFSIEWSRIQPNGSDDWDKAAVKHYRDYLAAMRRRGLTPVVTLWHFTNPVWFERLGGFEKAGNIKYLVSYAQRIVQELGEHIAYIVPVNEPDTYALESYTRDDWPPQKTNLALAFWVYLNLCRAQRQIYKRLRAVSRQSKGTKHPHCYQIGFNKGFTYYYRADGSWQSRLAEWLSYAILDDFVLALVRGRYDFIAVNYYFAVRYRGFKVQNPPAERLSDLGWGMQPQYLKQVLLRVARHHKKPLIVTESGVADVEDKYRRWWITENIKAIQAAKKQGVDVRGYLHWALLDNFEWARGRWPCFGLIAVDHKTLKRTIRPSALWYASAIKFLSGRL